MLKRFQSSFELTGYITDKRIISYDGDIVSKLFRAYGLYNCVTLYFNEMQGNLFQSSFELTGYITRKI